ncbi:MAG: glutathione S-transferase family protein [Pseudomonadota bacterium]|nr:glutathione S-transferase family protein [Pseudomonadota bacterium]
MTEILFHQYDSSPFSEKVRVCLGIKDLAWDAVDQPVVMPKPELVALTGGYRRIPVMQIGADIYCDSQLIVRELERRWPSPTLFPAGDRGLAGALALWSDRSFFQAAVTVIFGGLGDRLPEAFVKDREELRGQPFDTAAMRRAMPHARSQLRAQVALLAEQLSDGRDFLTGEAPGLADANAYYNLWFVRSAYPPAARWFEEDEVVRRWLDRVHMIGHGRRSQASREQALDRATSAAPLPASIDPMDELAELGGQEIHVAADDYGRDAVRGTLVGCSPFHVAIQREDARVGDVVVHFPRIGFTIGR